MIARSIRAHPYKILVVVLGGAISLGVYIVRTTNDAIRERNARESKTKGSDNKKEPKDSTKKKQPKDSKNKKKE